MPSSFFKKPSNRTGRSSGRGGERRGSGERGERRDFGRGGDRRSSGERGERRDFGRGGDRRSSGERGERRNFGGDRRSSGERGERRNFGGDRRSSGERGERRNFGGERRSSGERGERRTDGFADAAFKNQFFLVGSHAVRAALLNPIRQNQTLYLTPNQLEKLQQDQALMNNPRAQPLVRTAQIRPREFFDQLLLKTNKNIHAASAMPVTNLPQQLPQQLPHQGILLITRRLPQIDLEHFIQHELKKNQPHCFIMLDHVQDPHNIGAVIRSAGFFGATGLILSERHCPEETASLAKAASGGLELLPIIRVKNLATALRLLKQKGFWVYGFVGKGTEEITAPAVAAEKNTMHLHGLAFDQQSVLLFGAEGKGLRQLSSELADFKVTIGLDGLNHHLLANRTNRTDQPLNNLLNSLNVSNAAAIALYHWQITTQIKTEKTTETATEKTIETTAELNPTFNTMPI